MSDDRPAFDPVPGILDFMVRMQVETLKQLETIRSEAVHMQARLTRIETALTKPPPRGP